MSVTTLSEVPETIAVVGEEGSELSLGDKRTDDTPDVSCICLMFEPALPIIIPQLELGTKTRTTKSKPVGEASFDYLTGFCCYKINFVNPKTKRNLTGLFSKELKGTASPEYNINNAKKAFKAYIFAMRSGQMELAPPGWTIEKDIEIELLKDVAAQDVGIESLFNQ